MKRPIGISLSRRIIAFALAATVFMPWYSSQALKDGDTYLGNPLPLLDWAVIGLALAAALIYPRLAASAAVVSLISLGLTLFEMYWDHMEGLDVTVEYGLVAAGFTGATLLWQSMRHAKFRRSDAGKAPAGR